MICFFILYPLQCFNIPKYDCILCLKDVSEINPLSNSFCLFDIFLKILLFVLVLKAL